jgi:hypothetical protein
VRSFSSSASVDSAGVDDPEPVTVFDDDGSEDMAMDETNDSDRVQVEEDPVPVIRVFPPESLPVCHHSGTTSDALSSLTIQNTLG